MSSLFSFGGHGIGRGPGFHLTTHLPELYQPVEEDAFGRGHSVCSVICLGPAERDILTEDEVCLNQVRQEHLVPQADRLFHLGMVNR